MNKHSDQRRSVSHYFDGYFEIHSYNSTSNLFVLVVWYVDLIFAKHRAYNIL